MRSSSHSNQPVRCEIAVHHDTSHVVECQWSRVALDTDVPEAVGRQAWLEHVTACARRDDAVDLAGRERLGQEREVDEQMIGGDVAVRHRATRRG